jgi:hypothetical protein
MGALKELLDTPAARAALDAIGRRTVKFARAVLLDGLPAAIDETLDDVDEAASKARKNVGERVKRGKGATERMRQRKEKP